MKKLEKYINELEEDTKLNELNLHDKQLMLPGIKHKWVARLILHKVEIKKLRALLDKARDTIVQKKLKDQTVAMSRVSIEKMVDKHDVIVKIKSKIEDEKLMVLYLEKVETILRSMTYDIKNLTDIMKLESL